MGDRGLGDGLPGPIVGGHIAVDSQANDLTSQGHITGPFRHPVDHGTGLGTGQAFVGTKGAVGIAVDPAQGDSGADGIGRPVPGRHIGECRSAVSIGAKADQQVHELGTGDDIVGTEIGTVIKETQSAQGGDRSCIPLPGRNIQVGTGAIAPVGIDQQAVDQLSSLGTGQLVFGLEIALGEALHIADMILSEGRGIGRGQFLCFGHQALFLAFLLIHLGGLGRQDQKGQGYAGGQTQSSQPLPDSIHNTSLLFQISTTAHRHCEKFYGLILQ